MCDTQHMAGFISKLGFLTRNWSLEQQNRRQAQSHMRDPCRDHGPVIRIGSPAENLLKPFERFLGQFRISRNPRSGFWVGFDEVNEIANYLK